MQDSLKEGQTFVGSMMLENLIKIESNFICETIRIGPKSAYILKFNFISNTPLDRQNASSVAVEDAPTEILDLGDGPTVKSESHGGNTVSSLSHGNVQKPGDKPENSTGSESNAPNQESEMAYSSNDGESDAEYSDSDSSYSNESDSDSNYIEEDAEYSKQSGTR